MKFLHLYLWQFLAAFQVSYCLRLLFLRIPESRPEGKDVILTCEFDLEGDILYTIKWFHNDQEFFRFSPSEEPSTMFFPSRGIKLDLNQTTNTSVVLRDLELTSTGMFRCEVLTDAPHFQTVTAEAFMVVGEFYSGAYREISQSFCFIVILFIIYYL
ncbi:uncharacterized protein LOC118200441 [Stegodyphus dumicola]|uniref:uncharacterized protein LOC118200441 n=1 Tax=Stegodyphus dumicola TaxID=202533 RepID=UPI0015B1DE7A|nr:uncharacterized protein LOC118200441 [Stegodyphus dumicola]